MDIQTLKQELEKDLKINDAELDTESLKIPKIHNKYLNILHEEKILLQSLRLKKRIMLREKWEYYTGKLDDDDLKKHGWEPFRYALKSDITTYLDADEDINKYLANKMLNEEVVEVCNAILKELNSRTFQLRSFIDWEKFIQGV
jgi:ribosomal protein S3